MENGLAAGCGAGCNRQSMSSVVPLLELRGVRKSYERRALVALDGVNLVLQAGERLAIAGPSGCGKTTLLNILGALDEPDAGEVLHRGEALRGERMRSRFRRHTVGFVFQAFHLLPTLTAIENVQVPLVPTVRDSQARVQRARELLREVGLENRERHYPAELSGGERQRVAIARSLANEPELLLADEPTGNLDSASSELIGSLLRRCSGANGRSLCLVTHDLTLAERCADRILFMQDGKIVSEKVLSQAKLSPATP